MSGVCEENADDLLEIVDDVIPCVRPFEQGCEPTVTGARRRGGSFGGLGLRRELGGVQTPGPPGGEGTSPSPENDAAREGTAGHFGDSAPAAWPLFPPHPIGAW